MDFSSVTVPVVRGLSYAKIEQEGTEFLKLVAPECLEEPMPTPVLQIFENKMHLLEFDVVIGKNVRGLGGITDVTNRYIELPLATYNKLEKHEPQARFTVAHEFGHAKLHGSYQAFGTFPSRENVLLARRSEIRAFEDPEWQANAFAATILMPLEPMRMLHQRGMMHEHFVMRAFNVSWSAAKRRVMRLQNEFSK